MAALDSEEPSAATSSSCGPEVASDSTSSNTTTNTSSSRSSNSSNSSNNNSGSSPSATPASAAQAPKEAQAHAAAMREAMVSCVGLKEQYDRCFNHWYRQHFLQVSFSQHICFLSRGLVFDSRLWTEADWRRPVTGRKTGRDREARKESDEGEREGREKKEIEREREGKR
ncbi:hypothetical protein Esti_000228 [Eimeria stiedai]